MADRLSERVALVTGAGGGIGAAVARRLAAEGAAVAVADLDLEAAERTAHEIGATAGRARAVQVDVGDGDSAAQAVAAAVELAPGDTLHILVNNAGVIRPAMFGDLDEERFRTVLDVHLMGTYHCSRAALDHLPDDGTGRIINVTSAAGIQGTIGQANYASAKAAIIGLTKSLAKELARRAITANVLAPLAATAMTETVRTDERFAKQTLERIPMRRWAEPDEIAGAFAFLASDDAAYITGQVIPVDGGLVM